MFHVTPDPTQRSAVWCGQRVPDGHIAAVANSFTIREVTLDSPETFLYSSNLETAAASTGRWSHGQPIDFTRVFSGPEMGKKYSSGRRMWRIYNLLGDEVAAAALPSTYRTFDRNFSILRTTPSEIITLSTAAHISNSCSHSHANHFRCANGHLRPLNAHRGDARMSHAVSHVHRAAMRMEINRVWL